MSNPTKTLIAAAALAASGLATATDMTPAWHLGVENRAGLVGIPVCAKADKGDGKRYFWTDDMALRAALGMVSSGGCFERLGREGDLGYAQAGVTLIKAGGNVYKSAINGHAAGQALRALTAPQELVRSPEPIERVEASQ
jgi:hypothetical protein